MTKTLNSGTTIWCPVSEFLLRNDPNTIGQYATDDPLNPITVTALPTDPRVLACGKDASGLFESAVLRGEIYTVDDLTLLLNTDCNGQGLMFRIVGDIWWAFLFERRPNKELPTLPSVQRAAVWLEELEQGKKIFGFEETEDAALVETSIDSPQDVRQRNGDIVQAERYWGIRSNRVCPPNW